MAFARALGSMLVAVCALSASAASAQTYPSRPVTLVVPFAAGGATDAIARILVDPLSHDLGQQIVVETVGGAARRERHHQGDGPAGIGLRRRSTGA